jgi:hypothetical protein
MNVLYKNGAMLLKVDKAKFDSLLSKVLRTKPTPRDKIKTSGKNGPKTPILSKQ